MPKAFVFPGQGAQFSGMGRDLYDNYTEARSMMERANDILGFRLTDVMFDGTDEDLRQTRVTQPAIFLHSVVSAMMNTTLAPDAVAGHSLGEYSALVANGALRFEDAVSLVSERALAMQDACDQNPGTMAAVLGMDDEEVRRICQSLDGVVAANFNCPGQVVISGTVEGIEAACPVLKEAGAKRALRLPVGGAFHSPLMQPAAERLGRAIERTTFYTPRCPIYQNATATAVTSPDEIRHNLQAQLTAPVRWTESVRQMITDGITDFYEFGPGDVLKGLIKKIDNQVARCFCMLFLLGSSLLTSAAVRTPDQAMQIAQQHFATATTTAAGAQRVARAYSLSHIATYPRTHQSEAAFYVFGQEQSGGYVLVSADDRTEAILGYSDQGVFDVESMPEPMRDLLQSYQDQMALLNQPGLMRAPLATTTDSVLPLLGDIMWNQDAPYNNLCPQMTDGKRAYTGCVATATAQVMRYWRHPVRGTGSHSYTSHTQGYKLSATFNNVTYDWTNMLPQYKKDQYTTTEANAVAQLMYHVGVAADMDYNSDGKGSSSASLANMGKALYTYFGYDKSLRYMTRDFYSGNWDDLLRTELRAGRPIIYDGYCVSGHAFVCDGFSRRGYFHFNWGWGGNSNGYFLTSVLIPSGLGAGAGDGVYSFSQGCLIGVKPDAGGSLYTDPQLGYQYIEATTDSVGRLGSLAFTIHYLDNYGMTDFDGEIEMLIMNQTNNTIVDYIDNDSFDLPAGRFYSTYKLSGTTITLSNGTYRVALGYRPKGSSQWTIMPGNGGRPFYFTLYVTSNYRKVVPADDLFLSWQMEELETPYNSGRTRYAISVSNYGHAYSDSARIILRSWPDGNMVEDLGLVLVDAAEGETVEFERIISHSYAGKVYAELQYRGQTSRCSSPLYWTIFDPIDLWPTDFITSISGGLTTVRWQGKAPYYITELDGTYLGESVNYPSDTIYPSADGSFAAQYRLDSETRARMEVEYDNFSRLLFISDVYSFVVPTEPADQHVYILAKRKTGGNYYFLTPDKVSGQNRLVAVDAGTDDRSLVDTTTTSSSYLWTISQSEQGVTIQSGTGQYINCTAAKSIVLNNTPLVLTQRANTDGTITFLYAASATETRYLSLANTRSDFFVFYANENQADHLIMMHPKDPASAIFNPSSEKADCAAKILRDGRVLIIRNGKTYNILGQ